jgi:ATP-dependent Clp protease ATP-binding subunit ClpA
VRPAIDDAHASALSAVGIDATGAVPADTAPPQTPNVYRSSPSAQTVFQSASKLARSERGTQLAGAHVVIAVTELEHGTTARVLESLGIDRAALAAAARAELS